VFGVVALAITIVWFPVSLLRGLSPYRLSAGKFYIDELYWGLIVWPLHMLARGAYVWDRLVIDGLVDFVGRLPGWGGGLLRGLQSGLVSFYGLAMVLGLLTIIAARVVWGG
jgi:NADH-quinone oxidoreductase subunit L